MGALECVADLQKEKQRIELIESKAVSEIVFPKKIVFSTGTALPVGG